MQRRLVAILAADVAGYSRLMAADETGTHARLRALVERLIKPQIARHNGRLVKLMGDGLLAEFSSIVDAVTCAVAIQNSVADWQNDISEQRRMALRIGINIGDIISENDDIYGDGVNVVARLEALAKPGTICVSRTVRNHVHNKVEFGFAPMGEHRVKNIADPITVYRVLPEPGAVAKVVGRKSAGTPGWRWAASTIGLVFILLLAGAAFWLRAWAPTSGSEVLGEVAIPLPDKPSIAVLPFDVLGDDQDQKYFADGITEDLITDLSKAPGVFVIARNSSFAYEGQSPDVREIARDLGVRYILEGSVRRASDRVRINAQLVDGKTGGHIWADRYDGSLNDVFAVQDKVIRQIVTQLTGELSPTPDEFTRDEKTSPEAYDQFLLGWSHFRKNTPKHYAKAASHFRQAIKLDPDYARAHAALAWIYWNGRYEGWYVALGVDPSEAKRRAEKHLERAMARPPAIAYQVAASMALWRGQYEEAIAQGRRAIRLDQNDPGSLAALAEILIWNGSPDEAMPLAERARRTDPYNTAEYGLLQGRAQFHMNEFAAAAKSLKTALELNPDLWDTQTLCEPCVVLLSAYGHLDQEQLAADMHERLKAERSNYEIDINRYWYPYRREEDFERLVAGLRKAGLSL